LIDRIRHDIEQRLAQLLAEADMLRAALAALDGASATPSAPTQSASSRRQRRASTTTRRRQAPSSPPTRTVASTATSTRKRARRSRPDVKGAGDQQAQPRASGSARTVVLGALAGGEAMTAGAIAAATGLQRGTVGTTLSRRVKAGAVAKAERGYRLPQSAKS
jgi:hypothetical protein